MDSLKYLARAAQRLGLDVDVIDPGDDPAALHALVGAMQIQGIFTELRVQTHLKPNWKGSTSDVLDFLPIATVAPFADYYVADKKTYNLAVEAGLDQVRGCRIVHRLSELCDLLQQRLAWREGGSTSTGFAQPGASSRAWPFTRSSDHEGQLASHDSDTC